jgi:protein-S-isoprenylcysteine O-methyltransferase Ste14
MTEAVSRASMIPLPPLIYLIALIAGVLLGVFVPLPWLVGLLGEILVAVGWIGILGAAALWFSAIRAMRRVGTTLNPNGTPAHLLTGGAFGVSRNPLYLGNTLLLVGISHNRKCLDASDGRGRRAPYAEAGHRTGGEGPCPAVWQEVPRLRQARSALDLR